MSTTIDLTRVPSFYHNYILAVDARDLDAAMHKHVNTLTPFLEAIPADEWDYRYAPGKWSIKEMVQHIIDAERIFTYRALRFARRDSQMLPGFDENTYVDHSHAGDRMKEGLLEELSLLQRSTRIMFASFNEEDLEASGSANGSQVYVRALGFITVGHGLHHKNILQQRYLA